MFTIDAIDEIDYLLENDFFIKNNNVLYETNNTFYNEIANHGSRGHKQAIQIHNDADNEDANICDDVEELGGCESGSSEKVLTLNDINDINELENLVEVDTNTDDAPAKRTESRNQQK